MVRPYGLVAAVPSLPVELRHAVVNISARSKAELDLPMEPEEECRRWADDCVRHVIVGCRSPRNALAESPIKAQMVLDEGALRGGRLARGSPCWRHGLSDARAGPVLP